MQTSTQMCDCNFDFNKVSIVSHSTQQQDNEPQSIIRQVAFVARVSNPSNQQNHETDERLIKYLLKNNHWSPFEMVSICLEIQTTRDISRQILRHRSFSFQEFSQRYAKVEENKFTVREARLQDTKNRQNSIPLGKNLPESEELMLWWNTEQEKIYNNAINLYKEAIERGIAKEQARCILPEGNTITTLYMSGTLRSWIHYIMLRSGNGTQLEHRDVALKCMLEIEKIFPLIKDII